MLQNWLRSIPFDDIAPAELQDHQLGRQIRTYSDNLPDLRDVRLALLGVDAAAANSVRRELYRLSWAWPGLTMADLGNIRKKDIPFLISPVQELLASRIFPILIGSDPATTIGQYQAFLSLQQNISLVAVDEQLPLRSGSPDWRRYYLNDIIRTQPFHLGMIGVQSHFVDPVAVQVMEQNNFELVRLGQARRDLAEVEPLIRDADLLSINLSALRQADAPGQSDASPSGLTVEEAAQIARYGGLSDKLKSFGVFGYRSSLDRRRQTSQAIAQMIWYFIDGFYQRKGDFPASTDGLVEYIVDFKNQDYQLTFWKSTRSGRWWLQVPVETHKKIPRHRLIPCSYRDYQRAGQEELPDRLLRALRRFE